MKLLVIRHAIAEDRTEFAARAEDDAARPLTAEGRTKMKKGARGLAAVVPAIDLLASSPLTRAVQTARIVSSAYRDLPIAEVPELHPDADPASTVTWLRRHLRAEVVAVVGHEPHLGRLLGHLLTGRDRSFAVLKKGGACLIDFTGRPAAGRAELLWLLTASQLRRLA